MRYLWLGNSRSRRPTSLLSTRLLPPERRWRLRLESLWPRLWRRPDEYRLKPFAVLRKRFAAARLVFNLGMITPYIFARVRKAPHSSCSTRSLADRTPAANQPPAARSLLFWCKQHHHLPPFHQRVLFDHAVSSEIALYPVQKLATNVLMHHLAAAEPQGHLGLITL